MPRGASPAYKGGAAIFSFAIWDAHETRLFCARDHFGIKPFYYANVRDAFVFSNSIACIRVLTKISDELNERAIADFLLFRCQLRSRFYGIPRYPSPGSHTFPQRFGRKVVVQALLISANRRTHSIPPRRRIRRAFPDAAVRRCVGPPAHLSRRHPAQRGT